MKRILLNKITLIHIIIELTITSFFISSCTLFLIPAHKKISEEDIKMAELYTQKAIEKENSGDIYNALKYLILAREKNPSDTKSENIYNRIVSSLKAELTGTQEIIRKGKGIKNPLEYRIYRINNGIKTPVKNMPVHFSIVNGSGIITETGITNDIGIARCYLERVDSYDKELTIKAFVVIPDPEGNELKSLTRYFTFRKTSIKDKDIKILTETFLKITPDNEISTYTVDWFISYFIKAGFTSVSEIPSYDRKTFEKAFSGNKDAIQLIGTSFSSDILILIKVKEKESLQQSIDFFLSIMELSLLIADSHKGVVYFQSRASAKGAGKTRNESIKKSLQNCLITISNDLNNYIQKVEENNEF